MLQLRGARRGLGQQFIEVCGSGFVLRHTCLRSSDVAGQCQNGNSTSACGIGGVACSTCSASAVGLCTSTTSDGGLPTGAPCTDVSQCGGSDDIVFPGTGQSTCRAGYVCKTARTSDGGVEANSAHCEPNCNNAPPWQQGVSALGLLRALSV